MALPPPLAEPLAAAAAAALFFRSFSRPRVALFCWSDDFFERPPRMSQILRRLVSLTELLVEVVEADVVELFMVTCEE